MSEAIYYVYLHRKATTGEVFYVGKGKGNRAWKKSGRNRQWHSIVSECGYDVDVISDGMSEMQALAVERFFIAIHGDALANMTSGGQGASGYKHTDDSKEKMSERQFERFSDAKNVESLRSSQRNGWLQPGVRERFSKKVSERLSDPLVRERMRKETSERMKNPDVRENLRIKAIAQFSSAEARKRHSEALKIAHGTKEARERNSDAQKRRFQDVRQREALRMSSPLKKKVKNNDGVEFDSISDAARWLFGMGRKNLHSNEKNISACCRGKTGRAFGYEWEYV